jgi:hypothetical protein
VLSPVPVILVSVLAAAAMARFGTGMPGAREETTGFHWITFANTALAASTAAYLACLWKRSPRVGRAASMLAAFGAVGVPLGLFFDSQGPAPFAPSGPRLPPGLYEGTALLSAAAVLGCLAMERAYRTRKTAALVMPAAMLAVTCEIWLLRKGFSASGIPVPDLAGDWAAAFRFALCLGYVALAAGAAHALHALLRARTSENEADGRHAGAIAASVTVGAALLLTSSVIGALSAAAGAAASGGALALLPAAGLLPAALRMRGHSGEPGAATRALAWSALLAFFICTGGLWSYDSLAVALR